MCKDILGFAIQLRPLTLLSRDQDILLDPLRLMSLHTSHKFFFGGFLRRRFHDNNRSDFGMIVTPGVSSMAYDGFQILFRGVLR